jgi:hypothetical protein
MYENIQIFLSYGLTDDLVTGLKNLCFVYMYHVSCSTENIAYLNRNLEYKGDVVMKHSTQNIIRPDSPTFTGPDREGMRISVLRAVFHRSAAKGDLETFDYVSKSLEKVEDGITSDLVEKSLQKSEMFDSMTKRTETSTKPGEITLRLRKMTKTR